MYVVCAWYTPDYKPWADKLIASLESIGAPHDIVAVPAYSASWEAITMKKPMHVMDALQRHRDKTVIHLDVDCVALKPLDDLAAIRCDVGAHLRGKVGKNGRPRLGVRSSTLVFRPTPAARELVENWIHIGKTKPKGTVDRQTLPLALATTPGLTLETLDVKYCAYPSDKVADPVIAQSNASEGRPKIGDGMRRIYAMLGVSP